MASNLQKVFQQHLMIAALLIATIIAEQGMSGGGTSGSKHIPRRRIPVTTIFRNLGTMYIRKAYRMTQKSFLGLLDHIEGHMTHNKKRKRGKTPIGDIDPSSRLSMVLRWSAGGEPIDIMQTHGVGYDKVYKSVWRVVDATIRRCCLCK